MTSGFPLPERWAAGGAGVTLVAHVYNTQRKNALKAQMNILTANQQRLQTVKQYDTRIERLDEKRLRIHFSNLTQDTKNQLTENYTERSKKVEQEKETFLKQKSNIRGGYNRPFGSITISNYNRANSKKFHEEVGPSDNSYYILQTLPEFNEGNAIFFSVLVGISSFFLFDYVIQTLKNIYESENFKKKNGFFESTYIKFN